MQVAGASKQEMVVVMNNAACVVEDAHFSPERTGQSGCERSTLRNGAESCTVSNALSWLCRIPDAISDWKLGAHLEGISLGVCMICIHIQYKVV